MESELLVNTKPKSSFSEEIRTIRTNLQFTSADNDSKTILITSSTPSEGKSFISSNLGCAFAQSNEKVLLIDCDLRLGRLHKIFNISNENGLSNMLTVKDISEYSKYIKKIDIDNLYVITRGVNVINPSELLNSNRMIELIKLFKDKFDRIIFDGVPVIGLPDALIMANNVDRVVVVCTLGKTTIDELNETKKALEKVGANVAGVIANKLKRTRANKYYSYYDERNN